MTTQHKRDLSIIIPARNEMFLQRTIEDILLHIEADTEIIAVCDGYWPEPPVLDHPRVTIVHHTSPIGQRAATNEGARISQAQFLMKADAHCSFDQGFDRKLIDAHHATGDAATLVPLMYNLHAFDWECEQCGERTYQGPRPKLCPKCSSTSSHKMTVIWLPRRARVTYSWRFDSNLQFQYWREHRNRPETRRGDFIETLSFIGACWFLSRDRFWYLDGLDERHGSWGQVGTEVACKSWLSGGKLLTVKSTWFAHMFRTKNDGFSFPYPISGNDIVRAQRYSRHFWYNAKSSWPKAVHDLDWLISRFAPVPGWDKIPTPIAEKEVPLGLPNAS